MATVSHHDISSFFNSAFYKLEKKTKFLCLSSNFEETMAPFLNPLSSPFPHFP